jgi:amidase
VPHARFPGQPFGLSFMGKHWDEARILGYAYAFEQETAVRLKRKAYPAATPKTRLNDVVDAGMGIVEDEA